MTGLVVQSQELTHRVIRLAAVTLAVTALLALSFVLGRVSIGSTSTSTTIPRPAVTQPAGAGVAVSTTGCHIHQPC
jgi:hypothetical protein